jgi:hypothetical protein
MAICPNCGETFSSLPNGELCPDCRPPDSLIAGNALEDAEPTSEGEGLAAPIMAQPLGIAILSIWTCIEAALAVLGAVALLSGPSVITTVAEALGVAEGAFTRHPLETRLTAAGILLLGSFLACVVAWGLWKLRNWARVTTLLFSAMDLVLGGPLSKTPSRIVSLIVICYLLSPSVRARFLANRVEAIQTV